MRTSATGVPAGRGAAAAAVALFALLSACGDDDGDGVAAAERMRQRIAALAPAANIGHRGTGNTRAGHPFPENSLSSFAAAMAAGADGIELDVELTADGGLIVMHDDDLDRTTTCSGCVSDWTLEALRDCRLLDGDGVATDEAPPTLTESFAALPEDALVNVELKVYGDECRTATTGPRELARAAAAEVRRLGVADRTFFSSFDRTAALTIKDENPDLYSALLYSFPLPDDLSWAIEQGLDAIHPLLIIPADDVATARDAGLQVNVWTVNGAETMNAVLDLGPTAIITDQPDVLAAVLAQRSAD